MPGRVSTRRLFAEFLHPTGRGSSGPLRIVFVEKATHSAPSVAFAISRKVGNAVVRNTIRRRLRALVDEAAPHMKSGNYLIKCGNGTPELSYDELHSHLLNAVQRARAQRE